MKKVSSYVRVRKASRSSCEWTLGLCADGISVVEFVQPSHDSAAPRSKCFHASVCAREQHCLSVAGSDTEGNKESEFSCRKSPVTLIFI